MKTICPAGYHNGHVANHTLMCGCNIVRHVPKCMSCNKTINVITGRAHCFHDCIYITPVLHEISTMCFVDHL